MSTAYLDLPPSARPPTSGGSGGPNSPPETETTDSGPGTPASGISSLSTTAIKDGHEGHHPVVNLDVASERVARLAGIGTPPNVGYFDRDRASLLSGSGTGPSAQTMTPSASSVMSDGRVTPDGDAYGANSTQAKRETMAALIARRQLATSLSSSGSSSVQQQQQQQSQAQQQQQQAQQPPDYLGTTGLKNDDSPASVATTQTTPSVAESRANAKMIDGMTYDDNVVDTTAEGTSLRQGQKHQDDMDMDE